MAPTQSTLRCNWPQCQHGNVPIPIPCRDANCSNFTHHLCILAKEEELYKTAFPNLPWPPVGTIECPMSNPFETGTIRCFDCYTVKPSATEIAAHLAQYGHTGAPPNPAPGPAPAAAPAPPPGPAPAPPPGPAPAPPPAVAAPAPPPLPLGGTKRKAVPRKVKDPLLYRQFDINKLPGGGVSVACKNCSDYNKPKLSKFNPSKGRTHCLRCTGLDEETRKQLWAGSQVNKKKRDGVALLLASDPTETVATMRSNAMSLLSPLTQGSESSAPPATVDLTGPGVTVSTASTASISSASNTTASSTPAIARGKKKRHGPERSLDSNGHFGPALSAAAADKIILAEMKAILARGEPPSRLLDDYVQAALLQRYPAIGKFLPRDEQTIFTKYCIKVDIETTQELTTFISKLPGYINVALDGATINSKQKIVYTVSKSQFSVFSTWSDLGSVKHQTAAEVDDAYAICKAEMEKHDTQIASIPVDNAARGVAMEVAAKLRSKDGITVLVLRDPAHCIDLLSKDVAKTDVVKRVMGEAKEVRAFCKTDRIDSIRLEMARDGEIEGTWAAIDICETRMNLVHDFIRRARLQHDFLQLLGGNEQFQQYYRERSSAEKAKIDGILQRCRDPARWERMDMLCNNLACHFKRLHKICSRENVPLSAYPLLVQGLRNQLNQGLNANNGEFDTVLGAGSRKDIADMLRERFNMDGVDPDGRKVGLIDRFHLWAFLCDPFNHEWRSTFVLPAPLPILQKEMVEAYVPLDSDSDGSDGERRKVLKDFQEFYCQSNENTWMHCFEEPLPADVSNEELQKRNKEITIDDVEKWVEKHDGVRGRFLFYQMCGRTSPFYLKVAKSLVSMRTVGSIDVERRIKPIKNTILRKARNRLLDPKGVTLYRASENLKHIMAAKKALGKRITDNLV